MEELIKLLREYKPSEYDYVEHDGGIFNRETDSTGEYNRYFDLEPIIISKKFGFIKRLIENDKIETNHLSIQAFKEIFSGGGFVKVSDLEVLLMLLAMSDTPVEDLISYLK